MRNSSFGLRVADYELRVAGYGVRTLEPAKLGAPNRHYADVLAMKFFTTETRRTQRILFISVISVPLWLD